MYVSVKSFFIIIKKLLIGINKKINALSKSAVTPL